MEGAVKGAILFLLALFLVILSLTPLFPRATVSEATAFASIIVPDNFTTIQEAINNANSGDTIFVSSGIYYEHVVVNKTVVLIGENRETTIVDGSNAGTVIQITASNVKITGFKLQNTGWKWGRSGVEVYNVNNCEIEDNSVFLTCHQIRLVGSRGTKIIGNNISAPSDPFPQSAYGIRLENSTNCLIMNNRISNNIGGVHLGNATNCTVTGNNIFQNSQGIRLYSPCIDNNIIANTVYNNTYDGMIEAMPTNQTLVGNVFVHNNFINNSEPFIYKVTGCIWDNGYEGNYWTGYIGVDLDNNGIGDTIHHIGKEQDCYPLMGQYYEFHVSRETVTYSVALICNSSIDESSFSLKNNGITKAIIFNLTSKNSNLGFCRVSIPRALSDGPYTLLVDGSLESNATLRELPLSNDTYALLYFTYIGTAHAITISGVKENVNELHLEPYVILTLVVLLALAVTAMYLIGKGRGKIEEPSTQ